MIKINISIEADSVEEAKNAFAQLGASASVAEVAPAPAPVAEEKPKATRASKKEEPKVIPITQSADPLAGSAPTPNSNPVAGNPTVHADPIGAGSPSADPLATAPSADPLGSAAPVTDPLAGNTATAPANAPSAGTASAPSEITLQTIREKIGTLGDKKQQCKDLIATYKKADGTPCEKPSDIQEADYKSVYDDLDYV